MMYGTDDSLGASLLVIDAVIGSRRTQIQIHKLRAITDQLYHDRQFFVQTLACSKDDLFVVDDQRHTQIGMPLDPLQRRRQFSSAQHYPTRNLQRFAIDLIARSQHMFFGCIDDHDAVADGWPRCSSLWSTACGFFPCRMSLWPLH